jgi:hypothetical protein
VVVIHQDLPALKKAIVRAQARSMALATAMASLPPGTSRARVTTANARWARAAEERDRILKQVEEMEKQ